VSKAYRVHIVVDPFYGAHILDLPVGEPAWVVDSPENHPVISRIWKERPVLGQLSGITSFKFDAKTKPDDRLINILWSADLHHGEYSHDPPYSILNVIGVDWSEKIQEELDRFGFNSHEITLEGFVARRNLKGFLEKNKPEFDPPETL
jgi:hypothetical protein